MRSYTVCVKLSLLSIVLETFVLQEYWLATNICYNFTPTVYTIAHAYLTSKDMFYCKQLPKSIYVTIT